MKKIVHFIIITLIMITSLSAKADMFMRAEQLGMPVITSASVTSNINLTYPQIGISRLFATALEPYITNNDNSNIKIPVNKLFLICVGSHIN